AIAAHVREHPEFGFESADYRAQAGQLSQVPVIVIGYDTRFLSEAFAREAAEVFATFDMRSLVATSDVPTPAVAHAVLHHKAVGGVMITASHNPAQYNGYKWTPYWGGPATLAVTDDIERRVNLLAHSSVAAMSSERAERENWVVAQDFKPAYFKQLASLLDVPKLRGSRLKVGVDALRGAVRQYLRPFFQQVGIQAVGLHEDRDVLFGGGSSEPSPERLGELIALVKKDRLDLGFACDGDGDRFGIVDAGGVWIPANDVLALAVDHLVRNRGLKGKIARSLMSSHFVDAVAKSHGLAGCP
ncbi:MAG: phosphoglucomutase/phosphomannomutase family protein, partial [Elusimicrobia bacterium]|nr:phosphoglucomutase/phosphomannomutase family protein [Elusimicrobiota bacterium]